MKLRKVKSAVGNALEMPKDVSDNFPKIVLNGDTELFLGNYKGILQFQLTKIKLNACGKIIAIEGENLSIKSIENDEIVILGRITSVSFL